MAKHAYSCSSWCGWRISISFTIFIAIVFHLLSCLVKYLWVLDMLQVFGEMMHANCLRSFLFDPNIPNIHNMPTGLWTGAFFWSIHEQWILLLYDSIVLHETYDLHNLQDWFSGCTGILGLPYAQAILSILSKLLETDTLATRRGNWGIGGSFQHWWSCWGESTYQPTEKYEKVWQILWLEADWSRFKWQVRVPPRCSDDVLDENNQISTAGRKELATTGPHHGPHPIQEYNKQVFVLGQVPLDFSLEFVLRSLCHCESSSYGPGCQDFVDLKLHLGTCKLHMVIMVRKLLCRSLFVDMYAIPSRYTMIRLLSFSHVFSIVCFQRFYNVPFCPSNQNSRLVAQLHQGLWLYAFHLCARFGGRMRDFLL